MQNNVIVVNFGAHRRCSDPDCEECVVETVVDTYCDSHPLATRETARQLFVQGLAFQRSLDEALEG